MPIHATTASTRLFLSRLTARPHVANELVINWHLTEICNYSCEFCYSSWICKKREVDLFRNPETSSLLLKEIYRCFNANNHNNPLRNELDYTDLRLSLAGGEPLLFPEHTLRIVKEAKALGFSLSLITNASLLTFEIIPALVANLSILGISLDSANPETNRRIGRVDRSGRVLCLDDLAKKIDLARACNPKLKIKINTVVNALNVAEDLSEMIQSLRPDKLKLLRALPVMTDALSITDEQFNSSVKRHRHLGSLLAVENNRDMTESYIMITPDGRFFQNQSIPSIEQPYIYSEKVLKIGADAAFGQINFDTKKFVSRYVQSFSGEVAA